MLEAAVPGSAVAQRARKSFARLVSGANWAGRRGLQAAASARCGRGVNWVCIFRIGHVPSRVNMTLCVGCPSVLGYCRMREIAEPGSAVFPRARKGFVGHKSGGNRVCAVP